MAHTSASSEGAALPGREGGDPFGGHASSYASSWDQDPVASAFRAEVHRVLERHLPPAARVLDAGCGPGTDALWLRARGHEVVAIDASPGMVFRARARGVDARVLPVQQAGQVGSVDAALLDFGVVNCGALEPVARALGAVVRPGGLAVVVTMPRLHPSWMLGRLLRGDLAGAVARLAPLAEVPVADGRVRTRYWSAAELLRAFGRDWELVEQRGLGFLMPPPGSRRGAGLDALERPLRALPGLRQLGDHVVLVLRRRTAGQVTQPVPQRAWASSLRARLRRRSELRRAGRTGELRRLRVLVLHLTNGCNSGCLACHFRGPAGGEALTASRAGALAREAAELGATEALLTGGEPLLRPDLAELLAAVRTAGLRPLLLTNGLLLRKQAAVVARWCDEVVLSLDGHDAGTYQQARGVDGLGAVRAGVAALRQQAPGITLRARVTVTTANAGHLADIAALALDLGLDHLSFLAADLDSGAAFGRQGPADPSVVPDPAALRDELHALRAQLPAGFLQDSAYALDRVWSKYAADLGRQPHASPRCDAPWTSVVVGPDLALQPCFFIAADDPGAHARDGLRAGLYAMGRQLAELDVQTRPECQRCVCWAKLG